MTDCVVIGAGVVGLSIAYELSSRGLRVQLVDRREPGREASWAGAGILPAAVRRTGDAAYDQLSGLSHELHPIWAERLREETGIDNEFRRGGELFVARTGEGTETLKREIAAQKNRGIAVEELTAATLAETEPALAEGCNQGRLHASYRLPESARLRNPRHLGALATACAQRGVRICPNTEVTGIELRGSAIDGLTTSTGTLRAEKYCFATGAWTKDIVARLHRSLPIKPIRGQMVLMKMDAPLLGAVVHEDQHYLVPREDGRLLAGTTLEDAGFDKRNTSGAIRDILSFATSLVPRLAEAEIERCWAGLRPHSPEGQPFLGPIPDVENAFVAAGHFRWGLFLSPATAVVMSQLIRGEEPAVDLHDFRIDREES